MFPTTCCPILWPTGNCERRSAQGVLRAGRRRARATTETVCPVLSLAVAQHGKVNFGNIYALALFSCAAILAVGETVILRTPPLHPY